MAPFHLEIKQVSKYFGTAKETITALDNVSLTINHGEIVSIIGPSGCGKSTLLDLIAGLGTPQAGEIHLKGQNITGARGFVSYMPQKDVLFPWRTIEENVIVGLELQGLNKHQALTEARQLLNTFGLAGFAQALPGTLSGGMRQRAAFLRTYLCKKELMLLDEPFGKLDAITRLQMQNWLLQIWEQFRPTVLLVTHDVDEAILLSDRIYIMTPRPGKIAGVITNDLPRPRNLRLTTDSRFIQLKLQILELLMVDGLGGSPYDQQ